MIQMTTDGKIDLLQPKCNEIGKRIECDLNNFILQAFDIGYEEGYKTAAEFNAVKEESKPLTFRDIEVGDEIEISIDSPIYDHTVIIVTYNCSNRIYGFRKSTGSYVRLSQSDLSEWHKTGKTYPEIAKLIGGKSVQED